MGTSAIKFDINFRTNKSKVKEKSSMFFLFKKKPTWTSFLIPSIVFSYPILSFDERECCECPHVNTTMYTLWFRIVLPCQSQISTLYRTWPRLERTTVNKCNPSLCRKCMTVVGLYDLFHSVLVDQFSPRLYYLQVSVLTNLESEIQSVANIPS